MFVDEDGFDSLVGDNDNVVQPVGPATVVRVGPPVRCAPGMPADPDETRREFHGWSADEPEPARRLGVNRWWRLTGRTVEGQSRFVATAAGVIVESGIVLAVHADGERGLSRVDVDWQQPGEYLPRMWLPTGPGGPVAYLNS